MLPILDCYFDKKFINEFEVSLNNFWTVEDKANSRENKTISLSPRKEQLLTAKAAEANNKEEYKNLRADYAQKIPKLKAIIEKHQMQEQAFVISGTTRSDIPPVNQKEK